MAEQASPRVPARARLTRFTAAGPMYVACCSLLQTYRSANGTIHRNQAPAHDPGLENTLRVLALARSGLDCRKTSGRDPN